VGFVEAAAKIVRVDKKSGGDLVADAEREVISSYSECSSRMEKVSSRVKDVGFQQMVPS
jgi:hypothetical protein